MSHHESRDFSVLIVDDERPARSELRRMLLANGVTGPIREAESVPEALGLIREETPGVVFLDVQMPEYDGFSLLKQLPAPRPRVVFTTAHEQFAVRAFEEDALDYLLKPFGEERLDKALNRVTAQDGQEEHLTEGDSVLLKLDGECRLVPVLEIEYLETRLNTTEIFWGGRSGKLNRPLKRILAQLDPTIFFKASSNRVINLRHIASLDNGMFPCITAVMYSGKRLLFSRRQSIVFRKEHSI